MISFQISYSASFEVHLYYQSMFVVVVRLECRTEQAKVLFFTFLCRLCYCCL